VTRVTGLTGLVRLDPGTVVAGLRVERELGRGAFGVVYLAHDELIGRPVALKLIHKRAGADEKRERALEEARVVGRLKCPHIVTLHRVHPLPEQDAWLLEMEYIEGGSLKDLLEREPVLELDRALVILRGMLTALATAHEAGVVHGDVKPGNVLLERSGHVKLADFGLSWMLDDENLTDSIAGRPVGTPVYMAPECHMGNRGNKASDMWSVGVVFYRMISGRMPFKTGSLHDLFFSVQNSPPHPLPLEVPSDVQDLVLGMLEKRPDERPANASVVLERLAALAGARAPLPVAVPGPAPAPDLPPAPVLFGRDAELARLHSVLAQVDEGRGTAVLVTGVAGVGKTALVHALAADAAERGMRWVEASISPLEGTLRPLLRAVNRALAGESRQGLDALAAHSELTPQLLRDFAQEKIDVSLTSRQQVAWTVEQLFLGLARERPLLLLVENAHQADAEDHKLLRELARHLPQGRILFVITYRTHDVEASVSDTRSLAGFHELASVQGVEHVGLGPLGREAVFGLLERRSDGARIDSDIAERVIRLSEGNPLFAGELLRHLEEIGAIQLDGSSFRVGPEWDRASLPSRFHELVACRLAPLHEQDRALLEAAAVDGLTFDGEALEAVVGRSLLDVLRGLQRLYRDRGLVEPHGEGFRFTSTVMQEVIYNETAPALRRAIHRRLAEHLEKRGEEVDPERVGVHWERAGELEHAVPHLLRAAAAAAERQEHRRIVDLCTRAGLGAEGLDAATVREHAPTLLGLARAYDSLGERDLRERVYRVLLDAVDDERFRHRCRVSRARARYLTDGVGAVDEPRLREAVEALPDSRERADACYLLGMIEKYRGDLEAARDWLRQADATYEELGLLAQHSSALDQLASVALRSDRVHEAEALYGEAARISRSAGWRLNAVVSEVNRALAAFEIGKLDGLDASLEKSVHTLNLEGSRLSSAAAVVLAQVRYAQGDTGGAVRVVEQALEMLEGAVHLPSLQEARMEECHLAAVRGHLGVAEKSLDESRVAAEKTEDLLARVTTQCLEAHIACFAGDVDRAVRAAVRAVELARGTESGTTRAEPQLWLAEASWYGLPADVLEPLAGHPVVDAARLRTVDALEQGADHLKNHPPGRRRAALSILELWLSADALQLRGEKDLAADLTSKALEQATALGHVFMQIGLLRTLNMLTGDAAHKKARDTLLWRVAESLDDASERRRLLDYWA